MSAISAIKMEEILEEIFQSDSFLQESVTDKMEAFYQSESFLRASITKTAAEDANDILNLTISIPIPKESDFEEPLEEYVEEKYHNGENDWLTTMSSLTVIEQRRKMALEALNY